MMHSGKIGERNKNILRFLKKHRLAKINLMGHSLGGALALEFAYHYPGKVKRLFLVDSEGVYDRMTFPEMVYRFFFQRNSKWGASTKENIKTVFRFLRRPFFYSNLAYFAHHVDLQREAKKLKVPTIIIWAETDWITPLWQGRRLNKLIHRSKLVIIRKVNHNWIIHYPEKFWNIVKSHI